MTANVKRVKLSNQKYVVVGEPRGKDITKAQAMRAHATEMFKDDMVGYGEAITEIDYRSMSWCITEQNLGDKPDMLWIRLSELPVNDVRKIQDALEKIAGGDAGKKPGRS